MNRFILMVVSGMAAAFCLINNSAAQTAKDLAGSWRNVSNVTIHPDGKRTDNFGPKGIGQIIFGPDGRFVVVNINPDTPKFASNSRGTGTAEENKAAVLGGVGLFGTYNFDGKVVTMKVEGSTFPNWTGTEQKRNVISLTADELKWTLAGSLGGTSELVFKRLR